MAEWTRSDHRELEQRLRWRTRKARQWHGFLYLPDMLLSYGDFLTARGDDAGARRQYRGAAKAAHDAGYTFLEEIALRRLNGQWVPPVVEQLRGRGR